MTDDPERPRWDEGAFADVARAAARELADDAGGHGVRHARRVFALGTRLADAEGGDELVIGAAALLHDLHRSMGDEAFVDPAESLPAVEGILRAATFPPERIDAVCHCVAVHEAYDFAAGPNPAETLEAEIVQDADNLDALGAVGIGRAFTYGGARGRPMWNPEAEATAGVYDPAGDGRGDTIGHFHEKLFRLTESMNTETGREIAAERHAFMERFVDRFEAEWRGER